VDTVRAIDSGKIEVTINDKTAILSRYCPHEGADLSLGFIRNEKLICPWHNLCFNLDGSQPCKSLKNLRVYEN